VALEKLYSSVNIITTLNGGIPYGMTAAWVMQVSFEPPMVAVAIGKGGTTLRMILKTGRLGINTCGERCLETAIKFGTTSGPDKFAGVEWQERYGVPLVRGAIAFAVAEVMGKADAGDHTLITARVIHEETISPDKKPILYGEDAVLVIDRLSKIDF